MQPASIAPNTDSTDLEPADPAPAARCPFPHQAAAAAPAPAAAQCPFPHQATTGGRTVQRSRADMVVRSVLRIRERPAGVTSASAYSAFQRSMLISAVRCTLTYVVFPFVVPAVGFATGVGPILGIVIGVVAMTCDVFTIRRFFAVDHKWRWHFSAVALSVIGLLSVLLVQDIIHLVT